jgi:hypothetical protein
MQQLSTLESPEYSASTSLLTPEHQRLYDRWTNIVALLAAPQEHVAQAYRSNLGTGTEVGWREHVALTKEWVDTQRGTQFADELNDRLRALSAPGQRRLTLQSLWQRLAQFDTREEVLRELGPESLEWRGLQEVTRALTEEADGSRLKGHNEVKINNPTLVGIGILRQGGRTVYIENIDGAHLHQLLNGGEQPAWLSTGDRGGAPANAIVIPETIWREAVRRKLPLVVLD